MRRRLRYPLVALVAVPFLAGPATAATAHPPQDDAPVSAAQVVKIVGALPGRCGLLPDNLHDRPGGAPVRPLVGAYAHVGVGTGWISLDILAELLSIRLRVHVGVGFLTTVATTACSAASSGAAVSSGSTGVPRSIPHGPAPHRPVPAGSVPAGSAHATTSAHSPGVAAGRSGALGSSAVAGRSPAHPATAPHQPSAAHQASAASGVSDTVLRPVYRMHTGAQDPLRVNRNPLRNLTVVVIVSIVISAGVGAIFSGARGRAKP